MVARLGVFHSSFGSLMSGILPKTVWSLPVADMNLSRCGNSVFSDSSLLISIALIPAALVIACRATRWAEHRNRK